MEQSNLIWHDVAALSDLSAEDPLGVRVGDTMIGLYLLEEGVFALSDVCSHEFAILSEGFLEGPLHRVSAS